jgi:hypothetical protein
MSGKSPTQRSLEKLRQEGYLCQVVEKWNPHARIRQDLFGIGDILAIRDTETLLVQTTSRGNVNARIRKIEESEHLPAILKAGWKPGGLARCLYSDLDSRLFYRIG